MSYAEFAATYTSRATSEEIEDNQEDVVEVMDDDIIQTFPRSILLQGGLGVMKKRKRHIIIRFQRIKEEGENRYRHLLMLYLRRNQ